jgi:DNA-binding NarL/FixJ family response regulator
MTLSNLTAREMQILELVIAGYTNKEIAVAIYVSQKTVEYHLDNIYKKLGVRTRLLAGLWALEQDLNTGPRVTLD